MKPQAQKKKLRTPGKTKEIAEQIQEEGRQKEEKDS